MSQIAMDLPPMKAGGRWFGFTDGRQPTYVVDPEHQKRLSLEGAMIVPDPRDPHQVRMVSDEASLVRRAQVLEAQLAQQKREQELRAQIAQLEAQVAAQNVAQDAHLTAHTPVAGTREHVSLSREEVPAKGKK